MKKFIVYRLPVDKSMPKSEAELVAVEYGNDIAEATPAIVKSAIADLAAIPEYRGFEVTAYAPEVMNPGRSFNMTWMEWCAHPMLLRISLSNSLSKK